jgi:hypothetical protein
MDLERMRGFARELAALLEEPQRVQELDALLARATTSSGRRTPQTPRQS